MYIFVIFLLSCIIFMVLFYSDWKNYKVILSEDEKRHVDNLRQWQDYNIEKIKKLYGCSCEHEYEKPVPYDEDIHVYFVGVNQICEYTFWNEPGVPDKVLIRPYKDSQSPWLYLNHEELNVIDEFIERNFEQGVDVHSIVHEKMLELARSNIEEASWTIKNAQDFLDYHQLKDHK